MKRAGNLWPAVTAWGNLVESARAAALGKRSRPDVARFLFHLEPTVSALKRELEDGSYAPGPYKTFWISDPKPRLISAAPFRDRVVHHALTRVLEPVFEPRFTSSSFASRKGFGQHAALDLARTACGRYRFVLKADIRKYFPSIDHLILKQRLERSVKCERTLALAALIIDSSNAQEESNLYFQGDDLFTPFERSRGLPIGNQTSQFLSNVYLNPLDHFVLRDLQPAVYLRYVDDFVLFGEDERALTEMRVAVADFLAGLRLTLHEGKSRVYRCHDGVTYLGWRLFPDRTRLPRRQVVRARRRLDRMARRFHRGELDFSDISARVNAWLGHVKWGGTAELRRRLLSRFILNAAERGRSCVARRFLEQQSGEPPRVEP